MEKLTNRRGGKFGNEQVAKMSFLKNHEVEIFSLVRMLFQYYRSIYYYGKGEVIAILCAKEQVR